MKKIFSYIIAIIIVSCIALLLLDTVLMPIYVRSNQSRYLVDVKNRSLDQAISILNSEGFKSSVEDTLYTNQVEPNTIVDQYPKPNTRVKPGRTVRLKISQAEKMVTVPNLIGQSRRSADIILQQVGLTVDTVYTEFNPDYPKGTVAWQFPKSGDILKKGYGVHMTISEGMPPNFYQVPNLFGLSKTRAEAELEKAGLNLGKVIYEQNEDLIPYTVLNQSIIAGTVLNRPVAVDITVSVLDMQDIFNRMMDK